MGSLEGMSRVIWLMTLTSIAQVSIAQVPTAQVSPMPPRSVFLTAGMRETPSLIESTAAAAPADRFTAETSEYRQTGGYSEAVRWMRGLERRYPQRARVVEIGRTAEGRPLTMLVLSKFGLTPASAQASGKPVVLLQSGIHPGEIGGKDASLMLARDILVSRKFARWLDHLVVLILPVFNVDGHENRSQYHRINQNGPDEQGFRATAQRLNLNRDFMKADAPEMRAWLGMYNQWKPDLLVDNHVTDGQDCQYEVTIDVPEHGPVAPELAEWARHWYLPFLYQRMGEEGHVTGPYWPQDVFGPRYSQGYAAIRNRTGLLVETHSLKPYRTQVWAHYDIMKQTLDGLVEFGAELRQAVRQADARRPKEEALDWKLGGIPQDRVFLGLRADRVMSAVSGIRYDVYRNEPDNQVRKWYPEWTPVVKASLPRQYLVSQAWPEVIERLEAHGVPVRRLTQDAEFEVEQYRLVEPRFAAAPYEGRQTVQFQLRTEVRRLRARAGDVLVPLGDATDRLAQHLLEPAALDSLARWGSVNAIFERKEYFSSYVFEPVAAAMQAAHPEWKAEFERLLESDAEFAASPRRRLAWWYERSPYSEATLGLYPVWRIRADQP
jgi:murein tripeptide amidase MpaA